MKTKIIANLITIVATAIFVAGPNLNRNAEKSEPRWSARRPDDDNDKAVAVDILCLEDITVVDARSQEKGFGCVYRAQGTLCDIKDVPKNLVPVILDGCTRQFRTDVNNYDTQVYLSHLVMLPNGTALGVVKSKIES